MARRSRVEGLLESLAELEDGLRRRGVRGHIYLIGKSAFAFAVRANQTGEIENLGAGTIEEVIEETHRTGPADDWLKQVGETFGAADRRMVAATVWNTPHLVVTGAGAAHALAAKLRSEGTGDADDVKRLVDRLDLRTVDEAVGIYKETYCGAAPGPEAVARVCEAIDENRQRNRRERQEADRTMNMTTRASTRPMKVGDRVEHPTQPDWGMGQVFEIDSTKARVFFVGAGFKTISLQYVSLTILHPPPDHPLLDRLDPNAAGRAGYRSPKQSVKGFLESYPDGFHGERYRREERDYKEKASVLAAELLGRAEFDGLLAGRAFADVCRRALQVVDKTNLIFPNDKMVLKDGLKQAGREEAFGKALNALLHGEEAPSRRFNHFASVLEEMGADKWTTATYFPFLLYPDRHQFIKPTNTKNAAAICGFDIGYEPKPNWLAYERMLKFSDYLKSELAPLKPRDNIDVQSFMWAIAQG